LNACGTVPKPADVTMLGALNTGSQVSNLQHAQERYTHLIHTRLALPGAANNALRLPQPAGNDLG